jgi:ubiquitin-conjugating enzyme E2 J2
MNNTLLPLTLKRLLADVKILEKDPPEFLDAHPDENNMLIWYFLMRGTDEYKGGWYLGKIIHDKEYPLKPPDVQMMTPSGRYEINCNICLSFTKFHPDQWSAMWNIRSLLDGMYSNMQNDNKEEQGLGYIKETPQKRAEYAKKSIDYNLTHYQTLFKSFTRFINIDGTPKTDEEIKQSLKSEKKKEKKEKKDKSNDLSTDKVVQISQEMIDAVEKKKIKVKKSTTD